VSWSAIRLAKLIKNGAANSRYRITDKFTVLQSAMITAAGCYYSALLAPQETENFDEETAFIFAGRRPANRLVIFFK